MFALLKGGELDGGGTCLSWWLGGRTREGLERRVEELDAGIGLEGRRRKGWNGVKEGGSGGGSGAQLVRCTPNTEHCQPWDDFRPPFATVHNCTRPCAGMLPFAPQLSLPSLIMTTSVPEIGDRADIVSHPLKGICQSC